MPNDKTESEDGSWSGRSELPKDYLDRLKQVHRRKRPKGYLEIGVFDGSSLSLARQSAIAIGVDPNPQTNGDLPGNARLFEMTSDAFFASPSITDVFESQPLEMTFIDGMHLFEFVVRDVANAMVHSAPGALIFIHDTLPWNDAMASRERKTQAWTGDVWKIGACLHQTVPSVTVQTIDVAPTGLTVLSDFSPSDGEKLLGAETKLVKDLTSAGFDFFEAIGRGRLNVRPDTPLELGRIVQKAMSSGA